ncbi:hypothetical protein L1887_34398 [Cichorium endivia]|nr:hypothetical protein L1887_34398 [Cichorium endivia]
MELETLNSMVTLGRLMHDNGSTTLGFQIFMVVVATKREKKRGSSQSNRRDMKYETCGAPPSWRLRTLIAEIRRTASMKVISISDELDVWVGTTPVAVAIRRIWTGAPVSSHPHGPKVHNPYPPPRPLHHYSFCVTRPLSSLTVEERDEERHMWGSLLMVAENPNH